MHPKLIEIGNFYIPTYGFFVALGVILGVWFTLKLAAREGFSKEQIDQIGNLAIYSILGGLLGSKLLLIIVDFKYYIQNPADLIYVVRSGGVYYGGLIGGLITGIYFFKKYKLPVWKVGDIAAPHIALGQFFGRLGCFSAGCCYGKQCSCGWGITFHSEFAHNVVGTPLGIPLFPTQLMHAFSNLIIFLVLRFYFYPKKKFEGQILWFYVLFYSITRFIIEFFRGDTVRGFVFGILSTSQFISLVMFFIAIFMLYKLKPKKEQNA